MNIEIKITELVIETTAIVGNKNNIRGFFVWKFKSNIGQVIVRGGTIREKVFGSKRLLSCEPPCYGFKYHKAFIIENIEMYKEMCEETIKSYCKNSGTLPNDVVYEQHEEEQT